MDLTINNEIVNNRQNNEVKNFISELQNAIEKENSNIPHFYNDIYKELPLGSKYRENLSNIILECMKDMSYEKDFFYCDYDAKTNEYYLEYYCDGEIERFGLTEKDMENSEFKAGTFWRPYGDGMVQEADYIGEGIKSNVDYELSTLELSNKIGDNK